MLISKNVFVKINGKNIKHFRGLGYNVRQGDIIYVKVEELTHGSHVKVDVLCDYCFNIYCIPYKKYIEGVFHHPTKKISCVNCKSVKTSEGLSILFGVKNVMHLEGVRDKLKNTLISRYGVENPTSNPEIKEKARKSRSNLSEKDKRKIKEKTQATCLERYGVRSTLQSDKCRRNLYKARSSSSSQQSAVYCYLKEVYGDNIVDNFYISKLSLDMVLTIDGIKIDIEYDSSYWHNPIRDRRRDEFLKNKGYKILRIKSGRMIPNKNDVLEKIKKLITTDKKYESLVLPDWNEEEYKKGGDYE